MNWSDSKLIGFDLETTGPDPMTARPVQFAFAWYNHRAVTQARHGLINPEMPIPPDSTAVHGITDADVAERGGNYTRSLDGILRTLLEASVNRTVLVGMNMSYDLTVIDQCVRAVDGKGLRDHGWDGLCFDVLVADKHVDRYRKGSRKLSALAEVYGVEHHGAHTAMGDVLASVQVAFALSDRYTEISGATPEELHVLQRGWRREQSRSFSEYRVAKGEPALDESDGDWPIRGDVTVPVP